MGGRVAATDMWTSYEQHQLQAHNSLYCPSNVYVRGQPTHKPLTYLDGVVWWHLTPGSPPRGPVTLSLLQRRQQAAAYHTLRHQGMYWESRGWAPFKANKQEGEGAGWS